MNLKENCWKNKPNILKSVILLIIFLNQRSIKKLKKTYIKIIRYLNIIEAISYLMIVALEDKWKNVKGASTD